MNLFDNNIMNLRGVLDYEKQIKSSEIENKLVLDIKDLFLQDKEKASKYLEENSSFQRDLISNLKPESLAELINATGAISLLRSASYDQFKFYWGKLDPEFESANSTEVLQEIFKSRKSISQGVLDYYQL